MALEPDQDPLSRAVEAARRTEPEWVEVSSSILRKVGASLGPAEPVLVFTAAGSPDHDEDGSRTYVSTRVLRREVRRLLQSAPTHAPERIELDIEELRLRRIGVRLVAAYGVDLPELADRVRADLVDLVRGLLGPDPSFSGADVDIDFTDVVDGDPNRV